jgi:hypothetical protein
MSPRRILRIALSVEIIALFWTRAARQRHDMPAGWRIGGIAISTILLLVVLAELSGARRTRREPPPEKPLGLD